MSRILVLGNADLSCDRSSEIDRYDRVVRFNLPRGLGGLSGKKFDVWVICNGGAGRRLAESGGVLNAGYKNRPSELWFPRTTEIHRRWNTLHPGLLNSLVLNQEYARDIIQANQLNQPVKRHLGSDNYWQAIQALRDITYQFVMPSSGFVAVNQIPPAERVV